MVDRKERELLQSKYMSLAYGQSEQQRIAARDIAKQILRLPIEDTRDLQAKLKILETEIMSVKTPTQKTQYDLLELIALLAQSELRPVGATSGNPMKTFH